MERRHTEPGAAIYRAATTRELAPEVRADGNTLVGHFARFNQWNEIRSSIEGHFLERIKPGAFTKTFAERGPEGAGQIKVLFNHGHDAAIGRQALGVPTVLREDEIGPYYEVALFENAPPLVVEGIRAGAYGSSYMFGVVSDRETWNEQPGTSEHNPNGIPERTIEEVAAFEFGPVTFPADESATAGVRSLTDHFRTLPKLGEVPAAGPLEPEQRRAPQDPAPLHGTSDGYEARTAYLRRLQITRK